MQFAKRISSGVHLGPLGRRGVVSNMYILDQKNLSVQERSDKDLTWVEPVVRTGKKGIVEAQY